MKVVFMGTPDFAIPTLNKLIASCDVVAVYTQPDKPVGRGLKLQPSPVKELAVAHGIPVFTPEKVSLPEEVEKLKSFDADFFVIVAYGQILKLAVIEIPKYGCVNVHSSLLPRWRGAAPIQWSILGGDLETGITTMRIVPKLDAGDILLQAKTIISSTDTSSLVHDRLALMGAELILPTLAGLKEGTIKPIVQDESQVTYASKLTKEMENLDWSESASKIDLQVRALNPWPGTKITLINGQKIKIRAGKPKIGLNAQKPGTLFEKMGELYFSCGEGSYQVLDLQEEGKKSVHFQDYLNGLKGRGISLPLELGVGTV